MKHIGTLTLELTPGNVFKKAECSCGWAATGFRDGLAIQLELHIRNELRREAVKGTKYEGER